MSFIILNKFNQIIIFKYIKKVKKSYFNFLTKEIFPFPVD